MGFGCGGKGELGFLAARLEVDSCGADVLFFLYRLRGAEAPLFHGRAACFRVRRGSGDGGESRFLTSFGMTKSEGSGMTRFGQAFAPLRMTGWWWLLGAGGLGLWVGGAAYGVAGED